MSGIGRVVATLLVLLAVAPALAVTVPFEFSSNKIYVPVNVNGHGPFSFVLDTGSVSVTVDRARADALGITGHGEFDVHGAGDNAAKASTAHGVEIAAGEARVPPSDVELLPINALISSSEGRTVDGLLGCPFFERFIVQIDYVRRQVTFSDPARHPDSAHDEDALPLEIEGGNIFTTAEILLPDGERISGRFLVDTGWRSSVSLSAPFARAHRVNDRIPTITATTGVGIGGPVTSSVGRLRALCLGRHEIKEPVVDFALSARGFLAADNFAGVVGAEILRRFDVVFDYPHHRMFLRPNESFGRPVDFDMSGMYLVAHGADFRSFTVLNVTAGSAAAAADIRPGDEIETIDAQPASNHSLEEVRQMMRREGTEVSFGFRRGNERRVVKLTLRPLI